MVRGYVRVSTQKQTGGTSLQDQREELKKAGCEVLYEDVYTGGSLERPAFARLCGEVRRGDTVVVTKMDRFARTETEAYEQVVAWVREGVRVRVLNMGTIEDTEIGRLILHIMLSFAEFERDMIVNRTQGGRAYKRATDPGYREGRKPKFTRDRRDHAMELLRTHSFTEVARMTGMSRSTVVREARKRGIRKSEGESPKRG